MGSLVALDQGISWNRGRPDGQSQVSAGQLNFALRNDTGVFTPGLTTSARYPNVVLGRRARVTVRPTAAGNANLLAAEDASFESGTIGSWNASPFLYTAVTLANSSTAAQVGTKSMQITWPTATSGTSATAIALPNLVLGRQYTFSVYVNVTAGSQAVLVGAFFGNFPTTVPAGYAATTSTTGTFQRIAVTFTASTTSTFMVLANAAASTAGNTCLVDAVQLDEGITVGAFSTATVASRTTVRFDGTIDSLIVAMTSTGAVTLVSASDLLKQLGDNRPLRSILSEEILNDLPIAYWPLSEPTGASNAGDVSGAASVPQLTPTQRGAGGTFTFGTGTGPAYDQATGFLAERG